MELLLIVGKYIDQLTAPLLQIKLTNTLRHDWSRLLCAFIYVPLRSLDNNDQLLYLTRLDTISYPIPSILSHHGASSDMLLCLKIRSVGNELLSGTTGCAIDDIREQWSR